ncbi:Aldo/keto reductase, related to diketogulonate reductase [Geosmithia morbida]|uniref:Aldo/keto reductase, related to diketogulonate reductase n=1 Tax=Geosmithia morbida TaxID=1094350 RepID=A0A9P4YQR8_9HYPO|nr:Aldo/keto reductase, related to diketogulonate reductase [Geosmithia morbida]KAF4120325.1 Aldo/keto reductase, related to diketogulonate reductase [Geosmithia morbida]
MAAKTDSPSSVVAAPHLQIPPGLRQSLEDTKVKYRQLGKSGLRVSVPVFGTMGLGSKKSIPWALEADEALPLLKAAYDRGLNTWDTANVYSCGISEEIIGKTLKEYSIPREKVVIMTKCAFAVGEEPEIIPYFVGDALTRSKDYQNLAGLSRTAIFNQVEASLRRLGTPYIDLLQIHRFDPTVPVEETMKALHDLVQAGKVRYLGASSMRSVQFARMQFVAERNGWTPFVSMQNHHNLLYREEEREMNPFCDETGVGLIPWSPLAQGALARPVDQQKATQRGALPFLVLGQSPADQEIIKRVKETADKHGRTMAEIALAWSCGRNTSPIVGFSSVKRIDEAIEASYLELTADEVKYLEEPYQARPIIGHN